MKRKTRILLTTYIVAALAALSTLGWARNADLADYSQAARYSANRAFEETVQAVSGLSDTLAKSVYATGGSMCTRLCSQAYAQAEAAESALSVLPFSTQELEQISAFLNVAGDYTYSLCGPALEQGFDGETVENLTAMAETASSLVDSLRELQSHLHEGSVLPDSRPLRLQNIQPEDMPDKLSTRLLQYEEDFTPLAALHYDGRYGCEETEKAGYLTEEEMRAQAAAFLGVKPEELRQEYSYQGKNGQRCYRAGDSFLCVSRSGVESMTQIRLVSESLLTPEQAQTAAEDFLEKQGYQNLELLSSETRGAVQELRYAKTEDGAVCLDNTVSLAVALDDGSLYSFDACQYCADPSAVQWTVDRDAAAQALPASLRAQGCRAVIRKSPGKQDLACWEFDCLDDEERSVKVYVDAATGQQCQIEL